LTVKGRIIRPISADNKEIEMKTAQTEHNGHRQVSDDNPNQLSQIVHGMAIPAFVIDTDHAVIHWNKACEKLTGIASATMIGTRDAWKAFYPEKRPVLADLVVEQAPGCEIEGYYSDNYGISDLVDDAYEAHGYFPHLGEDGKWLYFTATPLKDASNRVIGAIETFQDITDRKRAERSLVESEERLRTLINATPDIICFKDGQGRWLEANDANLALFSLVDVDYRGKTDAELAAYTDPLCQEAFLGCQRSDDRAFTRKTICREEERIPHRDGIEKVYDVIKVPLFETDGSRKGLIVLGRDITDRKRAEEVLRESEEKLRQITSSAQDAIVMMDNRGLVTFWNESAEKIFGYAGQEVIGKELHAILAPPQFIERYEASFAIFRQSGKGPNLRKTTELSAIKKDGTEFPIELSLSAVNIRGRWNAIGIIRDITERKEAEAAREKMDKQLQQSQKMAAIGTLAGGIAHDFNNILSAILGYAELALVDLPPESALKNKLEGIQSSGNRARDLVEQILAFSRKEEQVMAPVAMNLLIEDALKLLRPTIPRTIAINTRTAAPCHVLGDPSRLHRIVLNLCTNAYQAMAENGGVLDILLSEEQLAGEAAAMAHLSPGRYAKLVVADTGVGIASDHVVHVFDPYFTTKEKGKGTGLGLATVHGIVKSHGGAIQVDSQIGKGTTFTVYLPSTQALHPPSKPVRPRLIGGTERILLIDDEPAILEIESEMLENLGYAVTGTRNASEALARFCETPDQFDLVITDMTMPVMTGAELAVELKKQRSDIPIVLCTGFSETMSEEKAAALGIKAFLLKPVTMTDLAQSVRRLLDRPTGK
jgi:PAS domain S-box-containing protein